MSTATRAERLDALKLLVVDDNRDCAESMAFLLRIFGHEVWVAFSGDEAVALADRFSFDVVLLDIGLPQMNGYEVALAMLRQVPHLFIIAVAGYGRQDDRRRCEEAGIALHLVKPVDLVAMKSLLAKFQRVIKDR